ncbi:MAG: hypothetical protein SFV23_10815, partial [Planctomycetaceae bacterium]|nr:hypothetical protein [Planctomycetaceae bacterium]
MPTSDAPLTAALPPAGALGTSFATAAGLLITVSAVLHGLAIIKAEPLQSANDRSRWCTIRALIEHGTYRIDAVRRIPGWDTIDLVYTGGHFYSSKPPLMVTWVAGVVWLICRTTGWTFAGDMAAINAVTLLLIHGLPFVLGLVGFARWLSRRMESYHGALFVLSVAAFGTLLSPFLTSLNNHSPAAAGVLLALLCWWRPAAKSTREGVLRFASWGFAASWAACHDLPAAAFTAVMLLAAIGVSPRFTLLCFIPAAALPVAGFFASNWAAIGSLAPAYSGYGGETYRFLYEGVPSYWLQPQGVDRALDSPWVYLLNCTIGHHGWWSLTPVWCMAYWPGISSTRKFDARELQIRWGTALISAVVLGFYLLRTENYNYGGVSCGLRWALFLTPLWLMALAVSVDRMPPCRWRHGLAGCLLGISVGAAWLPMSRPWQQPWAYQLAEHWNWTPTRDAPPALERRLFSWFAELPIAAAGQPSPWVEFTNESLPTSMERLRLTLLEDRVVGSRKCALVGIERRRDDVLTESRQLLIDRDRFNAGRPPAECLVWTDSNVTASQQQTDLAWFRGLPLMKEYAPGFERYVKLPLRSDAFACQRVAAQC